MLGNVGETEYLIEAYFADSSLADDYQTAYEQSEKNLPKNGQAITYTMIFLLSALTDLMMAMVFVLTGVLLIAIAVVCLRYVVLAQLEDDMREIGTMKAIGIPQKGICRLYLGKIRILMAAGCVTGYVLALLSSSLLTEHTSRTFGQQPLDIKSFILAGIVCFAVCAVILLFTRKILGRLQKSSVTDLLVTEKGFGKTGKVKDGLRKSKHLPINLLIALKEVRKGYGIVFGLLLIVSFLVIVPLRTVQTMESRQFVNYMGSPICDLLLEVEQGADLEERKATTEKILLAESEKGNIKNLSIADNIVFPAFQLGKRSRKAIVCDAENLMKKMGIISVADHDIRKVSGGQLQRAAICRAMINRPDILFGDEPTGALDSSSTKEVMYILEQINSSGTTILLVTHDAKVASRADRIIYLEDGKIKDELRQKKGIESNLNEWLAKMGF